MLRRLNDTFKKINYKFNKRQFDVTCRQIRCTPPIKHHPREDIIILTQVHHAAIDMYLLAIKSFLYHFPYGSVHVLDDGSLIEEDHTLLKQHIPNIKIEHINNIDIAECPRGGTWERLLHLVDLSQEAYVIQLDSDTFTSAPMLDVFDAVENQRGFITSAGPAWGSAINVDYLSAIVSNWQHDSIQPIAERNLAKLPFFSINKQYLRGCSAFVGVPKQQIDRDMVIEFSLQMSREIGMQKWSEWGSEQVASNAIISRTKNPLILTWPYYQNYGFPKVKSNDLKNAFFIHFIGTNRHINRDYQKLASRFIDKLMSK